MKTLKLFEDFNEKIDKDIPIDGWRQRLHLPNGDDGRWKFVQFNN